MSRLSMAGLPHHVLQKGHNSQEVVRDASDHEQLLGFARDAAGTNLVQIHAYVVVPGAVHWVLTPQHSEGVSGFMQALGRRYGRHFNERYGRSGSLWDGRFRSTVFEADLWMLPHLLWLDALPVRMGLAASPEGYEWSSAMHHIGESMRSGLVMPPQYWALGNTPFERESRYRQCLMDGLAQSVVQRIETAVQGGWALGGAQFVVDLERRLGRRVQPGARGRPRKVVGV